MCLRVSGKVQGQKLGTTVMSLFITAETVVPYRNFIETVNRSQLWIPSSLNLDDDPALELSTCIHPRHAAPLLIMEITNCQSMKKTLGGLSHRDPSAAGPAKELSSQH
jgi:hypothetical protein